MRGRTRNKGPNPLTRSFESNGPDVKIRGTAQHIADKYAQLARDAQASSDPVSAENYLQHAEHYYRLIAAAQEQFKQQYGAFQRSDEEGDEGDDDMQGPNGFGHPGERMNGDEFGDGGYGQPNPYEGRPGGDRPAQQPRYDRNDRQDRGEYRGDRQDRGGDNRGSDGRGDRPVQQRFDRGAEPRYDRNDRPDRNAQPDRGDRGAPAYDRGEGHRPDANRNGGEVNRPDQGRQDSNQGRQDGHQGRQDGNRRDRFTRNDGRGEPNRGDAPRQEGGRRDLARQERGGAAPRQDQPVRQDQPARHDQGRPDQTRQDAPRFEPADDVEGTGLPAFLMNPVRPPASAPDDVAPRATVPAQTPAADATEAADADTVSGIRPRRRRTRKVETPTDTTALIADDTPVD